MIFLQYWGLSPGRWCEPHPQLQAKLPGQGWNMRSSCLSYCTSRSGPDVRKGGAGLAHLRVLTPHVPAHGGARGHLGPAQLATLRLHLVVCELHVLLQHVLCHILLVAHGACPLLPHCKGQHRDRVTLGKVGLGPLALPLLIGDTRPLGQAKPVWGMTLSPWGGGRVEVPPPPVWMSLCVSIVFRSLKVFPHSSHMKSLIPAGRGP